MSQDNLWWVGVTMSACGSAAGAFGNHVVKFAHRGNEQAAVKVPSWKQPSWWLGLFLIIGVSTTLNVASYAFATQSLLASMAGLTLVCNTILDPCFLKEQVTWIDALGTFIIAAGMTGSVNFGPQASVSYTAAQLLDMYYVPTFLYYFGVVVVIQITLFLISRGYILPRFSKFCHPAMAGIIGGFSTTFAKSAIECLTETIHGQDQFTHPLAWLATVAAIVVSLTQLRELNGALRLYKVHLVVPIYQSFLLFSGVCNGIFYFQEGDSLHSLIDWIVFPLSLAVTVAGVFTISIFGGKTARVKAEEAAASKEREALLSSPASPTGKAAEEQRLLTLNKAQSVNA